MRALVTGGSGILGANLVRSLLAEGWEVRVLVRPGPPRRGLVGLPVELTPGDVLDPAALPPAVDGVDMVFHAAARFAYAGVHPSEMERVAVEGTRNVLAAAADAGVKRVVLTSSSVIFGSSAAPESRTEDDPLTPEDASAYARSKLRQWETALALSRSRGVDLVAVCPTLAVGGWDYGLSESNAVLVKYLNDPFRSTFPGGASLVSVGDVARGHILVAERGEGGTSYLLGADNLHWQEVHTEVSALCGTHGPLLTATHTGAYLTAAWSELAARFTGTPPALTRDEVRMMGRWYWYDHGRAAALGYRPASTREALLEALRWLLRTDHVRPEIRGFLKLAGETG